MLDGGMVVLNLIELMLGRPVSEGRSLRISGRCGVDWWFVSFVTHNDLIRIF